MRLAATTHAWQYFLLGMLTSTPCWLRMPMRRLVYLYSGFSVYMERRVSMTEVSIRSTCSEGFFIAYTMRETRYLHFTQRPPINHKQL